MKSKFLLFAIVTITFFSSACKKECPITTYPIEGYWTGTYTSKGPAPFIFVIEKSGALTVVDGSSFSTSPIGYGNWTLIGDVFTGSYSYCGIAKGGGCAIYLLKATWTNDGRLSNGTFGYSPSNSNGGTFSMSRTN